MPRHVRRIFKWIAIVAFLLFTCYTIRAWWTVIRDLKPSVGYSVEAQFTKLPADDAALETWLRSQPGMVQHTVHIDRADNKVYATFIMSKDLFGNTPFPELDKKCAELGYIGSEKWHDRPVSK